MDTHSERLVVPSDHWLDGLVDVDPYAALSLAALLLLALSYHLWRRLRGRRGDAPRSTRRVSPGGAHERA